MEPWQHWVLDVEQQEFLPSLVGMQNGTATLEDSLMVSYKTKYTLTILTGNYALWHLPKQTENVYLHKHLHPMFTVALFIIAKTWK